MGRAVEIPSYWVQPEFRALGPRMWVKMWVGRRPVGEKNCDGIRDC